MNLARSLYAACERHPEVEAFPGVRYGELLRPRAADRGRARRRARCAGGSRPRQPARDDAPLLGRTVGRRGVRPPLVEAVGGGARLLPRRLRREGRDPGRRPAAGWGRAPGSPRPRRARALAPALHLRHDRPAEGRTPLACRRPRGRTVAGAPARVCVGRPHARRDAPVPHDGGPLASRDAPRRRMLCAAGALGRGRGPAPDRGGADQLALPRADAVPRPRPPSIARLDRRRLGSRARVRGRRDALDARPPLRGGVLTGGVREPLRLDRGLHLLDRARPGREAGLRRTGGRQHAPARPRQRRDLRRPRLAGGIRRLLEPSGRGREGDPRRLVLGRATPGTSTRTATSGSTAASTT